MPARRVEPDILRYFLRAVRGRRSTRIEYQSLNDTRPDPIWRTITPHAFATDGLRWHLRAHCHRRPVAELLVLTNLFKFVVKRVGFSQIVRIAQLSDKICGSQE